MAEALKYTTFDTSFGWMGVLASSAGLVQMTLPQASLQEARDRLSPVAGSATYAPEAFQDLTDRVRSYFKGRRAFFPDRLDLSGATEFQRRVWEVTRLIPYGETRSYRWVAAELGKAEAVRAVGQALGRNPLPIIIPCHRVLGSDGGLCGFAGGLQMKHYLLRLER